MENYAAIILLDIIHRLVFYLKHVSETGFCLSLRVEPTPLDGDRTQSPNLGVSNKSQEAR
jgi:hypothetical protein